MQKYIRFQIKQKLNTAKNYVKFKLNVCEICKIISALNKNKTVLRNIERGY